MIVAHALNIHFLNQDNPLTYRVASDPSVGVAQDVNAVAATARIDEPMCWLWRARHVARTELHHRSASNPQTVTLSRQFQRLSGISAPF